MTGFVKLWYDRLPQWAKNKLRRMPGMAIMYFNYTITVEVSDGTKSVFPYAFYIESKKEDEIVILTEHTGYHIFPREDLKIKKKKM